MYLRNKIPLGSDNPLIIEFEFTGEFEENGLSNFSRLEVRIGDESYNSVDDPGVVYTVSDTELRVKLGKVTSLPKGEHPIEVWGITPLYDPLLINSESYANLPMVEII